jgi:ribonuclease Z
MDSKKVHWKTKWLIPNTGITLTGYSKSAYRTGFYLPELNIMLDGGPQNFNSPSHVFLTHTHMDHIANLPLTMIDCTDLKVYGPEEAERFFKRYIRAFLELNSCQTLPDEQYYEYFPVSQEAGRIEGPFCFKNRHFAAIEVFKCYHTVPTVGYGLIETKQKLKEEYKGMNGSEIGKLRKEGTCVTREENIPLIAYLCDTDNRALGCNPSLFTYKAIIVECTFLYEEHANETKERQHLHWQDLKPYVLEHPEIQFILMHFSQRYSDAEVQAFFDEQTDVPGNVKPWV